MRLFFTRKSGTFIVKHDLSYRLNSKNRSEFIIDFTQTTGDGSDLLKKRQVASCFVSISIEKLGYELFEKKLLIPTIVRSCILFGKYDVTKKL
jgi:iron complex outermembrane receptor protein